MSNKVKMNEDLVYIAFNTVGDEWQYSDLISDIEFKLETQIAELQVIAREIALSCNDELEYHNQSYENYWDKCYVYCSVESTPTNSLYNYNVYWNRNLPRKKRIPGEKNYRTERIKKTKRNAGYDSKTFEKLTTIRPDGTRVQQAPWSVSVIMKYEKLFQPLLKYKSLLLKELRSIRRLKNLYHLIFDDYAGAFGTSMREDNYPRLTYNYPTTDRNAFTYDRDFGIRIKKE